MGKHKDPGSPEGETFKADPSKATPDGHRKPKGKHADDKGKGGKK